MAELFLNHISNGAPSETPTVEVSSPSCAPDAAPIALTVYDGHCGAPGGVFLTVYEAKILCAAGVAVLRVCTASLVAGDVDAALD